MVTTLIFTLFCGIVLGLLLAISSLWLIKVNCPQCKQAKPIKEIILFQWKQRIITGQLCQKCQRPKPPVEEIEL